MPVDLFANAANTTLTAALTAGATSLTVTSSTPFPAVTTAANTQFRVIIDSELFIVTNVTGLTWTVTPGAEGTTQAAHASGAVVTAIATAGALGSKVALIGKTKYTPGTSVNKTLASTITTLTAVDASFLVVSFQVPASGAVIVNLQGFVGGPSGGVAASMDWGLINASGGATLDTTSTTYNLNSSGVSILVTQNFFLTGLTPGVVISAQWAWRCSYSASAGNVATLSYGATSPALMWVMSC